MGLRYKVDRWANRKISSRSLHVPLPFDRQQLEEFTCGPECLRAAFMYNGVRIDAEQLELESGCTPEEGTDWDGMIAACRLHGLVGELFRHDKAVQVIQTAKKHIVRREASIICIRAWGSTHFVMPVGLTGIHYKDDSRGVMLFYDPYLPAGTVGRLSVQALINKRRLETNDVLVIRQPARRMPIETIVI